MVNWLGVCDGVRADIEGMRKSGFVLRVSELLDGLFWSLAGETIVVYVLRVLSEAEELSVRIILLMVITFDGGRGCCASVIRLFTSSHRSMYYVYWRWRYSAMRSASV